MAESRRKFDQDFKEGAVRLVRETGKPIAQVARDLGINEGTPGQLGIPIGGAARIRRAVPGELGQRPPILALQPGQQAPHIRHRLPPRFHRPNRCPTRTPSSSNPAARAPTSTPTGQGCRTDHEQSQNDRCSTNLPSFSFTGRHRATTRKPLSPEQTPRRRTMQLWPPRGCQYLADLSH